VTVTIVGPADGETSEAQLEEDEFHTPWPVHRNQRKRRRADPAIGFALQNGWRIASASPEEQALLDARGFGSRRCSERR
jgi:hypothetical protein